VSSGVRNPSFLMIASLRRLGVNALEPRNISGPGDSEGVRPEDDSSYSHL
jgi:hypothetical protein